ncbi:MAG: hypothetical protein PHY92_02935 [Alphaproteobacteria bacterium]|nr:hypothetical protein [Alphaproteobacteria bacterium]
MIGAVSHKEALGLLSIALFIVGYSRYFWHIFKGQTKPHAFSWLVWGIITAIAFFAQNSDNAGPGAWTTGFGAVVYFVIAGLALFRGERDIKRSDWLAFTGALAAIPLWYLTGDPLSAVVLIAIIETLAFFPTIRKSYAKPHEETLFMYTMEILRFVPAIFALEHYSAVTLINPLYTIVLNGAFIVMALWRRAALARETRAAAGE